MNKEEISGKVDQVVGKVKQGIGEAIGNQKVANQGVIDQAKGAAKETWGNAKDAANQVRESQRKLPSRRPITCATISASQLRMPRRRLKRRSTNSKTVTLDKLPLQQSRHSAGSCFEVGLVNRGPPRLSLRRTKNRLPAGSADFQNSLNAPDPSSSHEALVEQPLRQQAVSAQLFPAGPCAALFCKFR